MNVRERLLTTLRGGTADRVPLVLPGLTYRTREEVAALANPRRRELAERAYEHVACHRQVSARINRMLVTPPQRIRRRHEDLPGGHRRTVGTIDTPKGELTFLTEYDPQAGTWWQVKYPVETLADVEAIASVPWELPEDLAPADASELPDDFAERGIFSCRISTPMVCLAGMMPYQMFLELCATHRALVEELTETCRRRVLDCMEVLLSGDPLEYWWMGGSEWLTPPMGSPDLYDALVQEQERGIIERIHRQPGSIVHVHCHGRVRYALERTIERGADYTEPVEPPPDGDITMAEAMAMADGRITLGGNVEVRLLAHGKANEVEAAARAVFAGGKRRLIFRPTEGPSPTISKQECRNYHRMLDVWEELSPIETGA